MKRLAVVVMGLVLAAVLATAADESSDPFKVIVNPRVTGQQIPKQVLAQIFLGQVRRWGDGSPIVPVDLSATSPIRAAFSNRVVGLPVEGVKQHWLHALLEGQHPPMIKGSDAEVLEFVASTPGAVGYVSSRANVPTTVKVVTILY